MTMRIGIAAAALVALGACGQSSQTAGGNSGTESRDSAPASILGGGGERLTPGYYDTTTEMQITGLPPEVARMMKARTTAGHECITPEEANRPSGDIFAGDKAQGCQSKDVAYGGGRIHGTMACTGQKGQGASTVTLDGTYNPTGYEVRVNIDMSAQGRKMTMQGHTVARRVGDCPAGEQ